MESARLTAGIMLNMALVNLIRFDARACMKGLINRLFSIKDQLRNPQTLFSRNYFWQSCFTFQFKCKQNGRNTEN